MIPDEINQSIKVIAKVSDPTTGTTVVNSVVVKMKQTAVWSLEPKRKYIHPGLPFVAFVSTSTDNFFSSIINI